ncbi:UBR7-like protein [Mya arenaria]|uniref:UBR7-like protein n=1 Tax=Mya arenaria TaxID=6604 RepID=A0ABY7FCL1_MYAAR|nr:UBR7-like protein [Mya arenaria]
MAEINRSTNAEEENEAETVISMVDYLQDEEDLQDDATAVLGDNDDKNCSYPLGYQSRQALYACITCKTKDNATAGVCLACSYDCHEGHELYELYTKRNFRCDCGNSKFPELTCKLCPEKDEVNPANSYNQNFKGVYCVCARPYPDPEDEHLGETKPPKNYSEMVCTACMSKHEFLWVYHVQCKDTQVVNSDSNVGSDVEVVQSSTSQETTSSNSEVSGSASNGVSSSASTNSLSTSASTQSNGLSSSASVQSSGSSTDLPSSERSISQQTSSAVGENDQQAMYRSQGLEFLPDESDTVLAYEKRGAAREGMSSQHDREQQVLNSMNRVQQIEMVQGFNDMKSALSDYLKHFAENGKVVRAEDIREFFTQMEQRKRQKTDHAPAHFCR